VGWGTGFHKRLREDTVHPLKLRWGVACQEVIGRRLRKLDRHVARANTGRHSPVCKKDPKTKISCRTKIKPQIQEDRQRGEIAFEKIQIIDERKKVAVKVRATKKENTAPTGQRGKPKSKKKKKQNKKKKV